MSDYFEEVYKEMLRTGEVSTKYDPLNRQMLKRVNFLLHNQIPLVNVRSNRRKARSRAKKISEVVYVPYPHRRGGLRDLPALKQIVASLCEIILNYNIDTDSDYIDNIIQGTIDFFKRDKDRMYTSRPDEVLPLLYKAMNALPGRRYQIMLLTTALPFNEESLLTHLCLCDHHIHSGDFHNARVSSEILTSILKENNPLQRDYTDNARAHCLVDSRKGLVDFAMGEYDKAKHALSNVIDTSRMTDPSLFYLSSLVMGYIHFREGRDEEAKSCFESLLYDSPDENQLPVVTGAHPGSSKIVYLGISYNDVLNDSFNTRLVRHMASIAYGDMLFILGNESKADEHYANVLREITSDEIKHSPLAVVAVIIGYERLNRVEDPQAWNRHDVINQLGGFLFGDYHLNMKDHPLFALPRGPVKCSTEDLQKFPWDPGTRYSMCDG